MLGIVKVFFSKYVFELMQFIVNIAELFRLDSEIHNVETEVTQICSSLTNRYYPFCYINKMERKTLRKICRNGMSR